MFYKRVLSVIFCEKTQGSRFYVETCSFTISLSFCYILLNSLYSTMKNEKCSEIEFALFSVLVGGIGLSSNLSQKRVNVYVTAASILISSSLRFNVPLDDRAKLVSVLIIHHSTVLLTLTCSCV